MEQNMPFNVLSNTANKEDTISQVAAMINNSGYNRGQRRRLEKALSKTNKLTERAQKKLDDSAYREYQEAVSKNYLHFFAILALTAGEDYKWQEDDKHDQISSLLERVDKKIKKYANQGYNTEDLISMVDEKYGIVLIPDNH